jgi:hypothetical protein
MPHNRDDMLYHPPGTTRYDMQFKSGARENGVTETEICGPTTIGHTVALGR